uniref:Alpha/beta hydrolase n=1 Tax=Angiostrongylus cantonensis TaxID=6313 RepID=A0A0K0DHI9_ANGCA
MRFGPVPLGSDIFEKSEEFRLGISVAENETEDVGQTGCVLIPGGVRPGTDVPVVGLNHGLTHREIAVLRATFPRLKSLRALAGSSNRFA